MNLYQGKEKVELLGFVTNYKGKTIAVVTDPETGKLNEVQLGQLNTMPEDKAKKAADSANEKTMESQKSMEPTHEVDNNRLEMSEPDASDKSLLDKAKDLAHKVTHPNESKNEKPQSNK